MPAARFVEQVRPEAFQQVDGLLVDNPAGFAAFGAAAAAAAMLLVRAVRTRNTTSALSQR